MAAKTKKGSRWHTIEEYELALEKAGGFLSEAAKMLGVTPAAVTRRIKKSKRLQKHLKNVQNFHLDVAESKLLAAVDKEKGWAVMYYLNNKGKSRGYARKWWEDDPTKEQVDGVTWTDPGPPQTPDGDDVGINVDKLLEDLPDRSQLTEQDLGLNGKGALGTGQRVNGERNGQD